ncbi:orotate phosphoribosyltransferase [Methanoculleus sp. MH98A]|uniref:orotate phosphoribosyltransferase n=1 Tax=Methanoculleus sp. MH98A TaxID=1495314 RepID=UPI00049F52A4|nr:orotate phosphoribosyltransferase [Methanoculleus sp. MH98A]KDE56158.1 orotate phosphoribosyltransferase [Methanoculleus sp. MH98A]
MVNPIATLLLECGAIEFGEFVLASGAQSSYYIDIKAATTNPAILREIGKAIAEREDFEMVAGVAVGAVPIAVAVSLASGRPYAIIRKEEKGHGKSGTIIGDVTGKNVLLVEDVTTSGGSALYGLEALRAAGAHVDRVMTVVDREAGAREALAEKGASLLALVRVSELLDG